MATPNINEALLALEAELARDASVNSSAATLITRLLADIEANKGAPAAIQAIVDQYRAQTDALAASVAAGTPAEEPPVDPQARRR